MRVLFSALIVLLLNMVGMPIVCAQGNAPTGAINGLFSVSENNQVYFSHGNLQYIGSSATPYWKFADHQWDYLGTTTDQNSDSQTVDRDLFAWGTSGYDHGANFYQPWSLFGGYSDYFVYGNMGDNLFDQTGQADWGYNAITNGGNIENSGWRTLTQEEWQYVFKTRSTSSGKRYAKANVNSINGVILLPDDWSSSYYSLNNTNKNGASFSSNTITAAQWNTLEQHGAVFLPAAGDWDETWLCNVGSRGIYWSASNYNSTIAWLVSFDDTYLQTDGYSNRRYGRSVRLVRPAETFTSSIEFADPNVKAICVEHWDTNGDGELSYAEAAAVTNMENVFAGNHEIVSFDEFQYFTGVTAINSYDFNDCSLTSIMLPNTIITIGYAAFDGCTGLTSIIIPNSVTTIEGFAFAGSCGMSSIEIPSSVTSLQGAFCPDGLEQIVVDPENTVYDSRENCNAIIETNSNRMVLGCRNTVIPNSVTSIGDNAFGGCTSLTSIEIPNSVTSIGNSAFGGCTSLTSIAIPNSVTYIGGEVFSGCSDLVQMVVASGNTVYDSRGNCNAIIETSNNKLISGCKNTVIPNTVTSIGGYAFESCIMTSITIPSSVSSIDFAAFVYCTNLASITVLSETPPVLGGDVFIDVDKSIPVYVPSGSMSTYQNAEGWNEFTNFVEIYSGDTPLGAINGLFSVSENNQVYFSKGNLQYQASTNIWRFAENQWDYVGEDNANISETYDGWIDLFGWGTSGYNHGANCYQPWSTSQNNSDYFAYGNYGW